MDYNKHMIGLLNYISKNIGKDKYETKYVSDVLEFNPDGSPIEQQDKRLMDEVCKEVAERIVETFYSREYEEGKFKEFWEGSFRKDKEEIVKKLESEFYCNAYAENAIKN